MLVNQGLSLARRIARSVFAGMGAVTLLLVLVPFAVDQDLRVVVAKHDWSDYEFKAMAIGFTVWIIMAAAFLSAAFLIPIANSWGLFVLSLCNALILAVIWPKAAGKDLVLIPPLCLSMIALLFEDYRILAKARRNPA